MSVAGVSRNPPTAWFSGIKVQRLTFVIYLVSGTLAGIASFVFMRRLGSAPHAAGDPLLLQIIGAIVLGRKTLAGGEGRHPALDHQGGAVLIAMIVKRLEILGAQFWDQMIVNGELTALGSALGSWLSRRRSSGYVRRTAGSLDPGVGAPRGPAAALGGQPAPP